MKRTRLSSKNDSKDGDNSRKQKILTASERLFAHFGYDGVSIRDIAAAADVNSALIRYYFGAKDQLYRALFEERYRAITGRRETALKQLAIEPNSFDTLLGIVRAWVPPLLELMDELESTNFVLLLAREASLGMGDIHHVYRDFLDPSARVCISVMRRTFPNVPRNDLVQGYIWMIATVTSTLMGVDRAQRLGADKGLMSLTAVQPKLENFVANGLWSLYSPSANKLEVRTSLISKPKARPHRQRVVKKR